MDKFVSKYERSVKEWQDKKLQADRDRSAISSDHTFTPQLNPISRRIVDKIDKPVTTTQKLKQKITTIKKPKAEVESQ